MSEYFIFYKETPKGYRFCSISANLDQVDYRENLLQYNEGFIGEINDFEVWPQVKKTEALEKINELKEEYNSPAPPQSEIEILFNLSGAIGKYDQEAFDNLVKHLWATTRYISVHAGLGLFNEPEPSYDLIRTTLKFGYKFRVADKDQFKSLYITYMLLGEIEEDWIEIN